MIYNPKISKCDFDPTNQSFSFFKGKSSGKKIRIIDLDGPRMVEDSVKQYFIKLCKEKNVEESEIKFYDDSIRSNAENANNIGTNFRIYFRGHQFLFSYDSFETITYEVIEHDFGGFLKKDAPEITVFLESQLHEEKMRGKVRRGSGNSWRKPPPDDEDYCTGEYYWNID